MKTDGAKRLAFVRAATFGLALAASAPSLANQEAQKFANCLDELALVAQAEGIPAKLTNKVLGTLQFQPRVIELDRAQPEFQQTFSAYLRSRVTATRVQRGRELRSKHRQLLDELAQEYDVPGHYLVALWGMESNFGSYTGRMPILDSLATLACDDRRSAFFRDQLITALRLIDRDSLQPAAMLGSWAGAMGQTQFMPSAYYAHAVDGDGDGLIDLWNSSADALASGASLLQGLGWTPGERWGREVSLVAGFPFEKSGFDQPRPLAEWAELGVRQSDGTALPVADMSARLLLPMGHTGPAFLVYNNFDVLLGWNRSISFALAVGHLADRIAGAGALHANLPTGSDTIAVAELAGIQRQLAELGYRPGEADGILGPATRGALRAFQGDHGLVPDGYPDEQTRNALIVDSRASDP
ncbi:MAG: lytic murein transglycosylase [Wenzhouxiangella sp.]|jgi:membrane-bound lytic murein transglycosylase B|nr:lytic murein transglycosylase [Wenzhouxiangella sp.]